MGSASEAQSQKCYAGAAVGLAASPTVERQGTVDGEGVRHSAVETGVGARVWDKSWAADHWGRGVGEAEPGGGQRYKRLRSGRQGSTCRGCAEQSAEEEGWRH